MTRVDIEFTLFTKAGGPLTKRIALDATGKVVSDGSACVMAHGTAERVKVDDVAGLGTLIEQLTLSQALALGSLRADLPDQVKIVTEGALQNGAAQPGTIARTSANIVYHGPAFVLLDFDTKGMPPSVAVELSRRGGFWPALKTVLPSLGNLTHLTRSSTSAGLSRADTGASIPGSNGVHVYITIKDGGDADRFLHALHDRCWLAGLGWLMVRKSGALLERSIVDRIVGGPERLVFESGPDLVSPLQQDAACRRPITTEGAVAMLDTAALCLSLSSVEQARLAELKAKERERLAPEEAKARDHFVAVEVKNLVARTGMTERSVRTTVKRWCEGVLRPDVVLPFDDAALAGCTVGDVLADPARFTGETLADPLEGVAYGRCVAKIMRRANGTPWIHSFAHGRTIYLLQYDAGAVRKVLEATPKQEVAANFAILAAKADIDAVALEELRQLAKERSGVSLRAINAILKSAQQRQAKANAKARQSLLASRRTDPRVRIRAPLPDEPWLPQIEVLNEVIGAVVTEIPPSRDIEDDMMWVRQLAVPGTHAFIDANLEAGSEKLPPPEQWALCKMTEMEVAELIERHIDYYATDNNGNERSVHLPMQFVRHFLNRSDGVLPTTVAYATMPLVLPDGHLLAPIGLDRARGIQFLIQDEMRAIIAQPQDCTAEAVKAAMVFLTDKWLIDVATSYTGKAIIIADALTLIERTLLAERPCFFYTAGRRGSGKTTTIFMLIMAVLGRPPVASAWSSNEEERRKALMSHFILGMPYILWDNIPRGLQISCPHIERSCTAAYYSDRRLGVSEIAQAAASTIHHFTGNNIAAKGDLASRILYVRLDVNRADPENREVTNPYPIDWTEQHRGEILGALFTILLGNPQLDAAHDAAGKTRFKMWWRLVGSAIEYAAELVGQHVDFRELFIAQEEDDEEATSLADVLEILLRRFPNGFQAKEATATINQTFSTDDDVQTLREYLMPGALPGHVFTSKAVSKRLKKHLDEPVFCGSRTLTLRWYMDLHTEVRVFHVAEQGS